MKPQSYVGSSHVAASAFRSSRPLPRKCRGLFSKSQSNAYEPFLFTGRSANYNEKFTLIRKMHIASCDHKFQHDWTIFGLVMIFCMLKNKTENKYSTSI